jgi:hypothetical protein
LYSVKLIGINSCSTITVVSLIDFGSPKKIGYSKSR